MGDKRYISFNCFLRSPFCRTSAFIASAFLLSAPEPKYHIRNLKPADHPANKPQGLLFRLHKFYTDFKATKKHYRPHNLQCSSYLIHISDPELKYIKSHVIHFSCIIGISYIVWLVRLMHKIFHSWDQDIPSLFSCLQT